MTEKWNEGGAREGFQRSATCSLFKAELSCAVINVFFFLLDKFYTHLVYIRFFIMNKTHTQKKF